MAWRPNICKRRQGGIPAVPAWPPRLHREKVCHPGLLNYPSSDADPEHSLAYVEMRTILARVIWSFDMKISDGSLDWMPKQKVYLLWKKGPLNVYLDPVMSD